MESLWSASYKSHISTHGSLLTSMSYEGYKSTEERGAILTGEGNEEGKGDGGYVGLRKWRR